MAEHKLHKICLKMPKGRSEAVYQRTAMTMANRKMSNNDLQTTIQKTKE